MVVRLYRWVPNLKGNMLVQNFPVHTLQDWIAYDKANKNGYHSQVDTKWETTEIESTLKLRGLFPIFAVFATDTGHTTYIEVEDAVFWVDSSKKNTNVNMTIFVKDHTTAQYYIEKVKTTIPMAPEPSINDISVRFWYLTNDGPRSVRRNIAAPSWENMDRNYTSSTKEGLSHLMTNFKPTGGGKLILWHGEPGTGKTYALRALCQSWKAWCSSEYILDPETLLGASPGYLASMIMDASASEWDEDDEEITEKNKWKLLIMEDTGELLTENARERSGQGLARLLNVVDGFIGQGLRVLVLITTNEEFESLHPAVAREGRCAASVKFNELNSEEAYAFLKHNNISRGLNKRTYSIAQLYAMVKDHEMPRDILGKEAKHNLGFRMPSNV